MKEIKIDIKHSYKTGEGTIKIGIPGIVGSRHNFKSFEIDMSRIAVTKEVDEKSESWKEQVPGDIITTKMTFRL